MVFSMLVHLSIIQIYTLQEGARVFKVLKYDLVTNLTPVVKGERAPVRTALPTRTAFSISLYELHNLQEKLLTYFPDLHSEADNGRRWILNPFFRKVSRSG